MTLADFYLVCFLVGFLLSVTSLLLGSLDLHIHLPHAGDGFHLHLGEGAGHVAGHAAGHAIHGVGHAVHGHGAHAQAATEAGISPFNFGTIAAFLAWFGGTGYLLTRWSPLVSLIALGLALVAGVAGGAVVFWFLAKLASHDENLDPADYDMMGVLGKVTSGIREGGTGEIVYSQEGSRRTCGARSEDGSAIDKGSEVVVSRYEKGIAYVERWEKLRDEGTPP